MLAAKHERWAQLDDVAVDSLAAGEQKQLDQLRLRFWTLRAFSFE
jgi:hypothetical protein